MKKALSSLFVIVIFFAGASNFASGMTALHKSDSTFNQLLPFNDKQLFPDSNQAPLRNPLLTDTCNNTELSLALTKNKKDMSHGLLKKYRIMSYYGHPKSTQMGILGQLSPNELITQLKKQAEAYTELDPCHPVIPAIELIATVAGRTPGPSGLYYYETSLADINRYAKLANENGVLLILDVQLGRDSVIHQVQMLKEFLKLPYVYLAIDTEFHVGNGQIPGAQLGRVDGYTIEKAIQYVSDLTEEFDLPDKVVIIHQFKDDVIRNKNVIKPTKHVELVLNFDGFGSPQNKRKGYRLLVKNQPVQYGGFKLFYKKDSPLLTPKDVLNLNPTPVFIDYQ